MSSVYKYRDPNDKITYVERSKLLEDLKKRREKVYSYAIMKDAEKRLYDDYKYKKKERYGVFGDGTIKDIYPYKSEMYTHYDGNNPALVQGGQIVISTRALYNSQLNESYKKASEPAYLTKYPSV